MDSNIGDHNGRGSDEPWTFKNHLKSAKSIVNEPLVSLNCGLYHVGDVAYLRFWTGMSSWSQRFQDQCCPRSALG